MYNIVIISILKIKKKIGHYRDVFLLFNIKVKITYFRVTTNISDGEANVSIFFLCFNKLICKMLQ